MFEEKFLFSAFQTVIAKVKNRIYSRSSGRCQIQRFIAPELEFALWAAAVYTVFLVAKSATYIVSMCLSMMCDPEGPPSCEQLCHARFRARAHNVL